MSADANNEPDAITPAHVYFNRRQLVRAGLLAGSTMATAALYRQFNPPGRAPPDETGEPGRMALGSGNRAGNRANNDAGHDQAAAGDAQHTAAGAGSLTTSSSGDTEPSVESGFRTDEQLTPLRAIVNYNNFYEFSTSKEQVARVAAGFDTEKWQLAVDGLVRVPKVFELRELRAIGPPEQRVYRMRCVEAWSMVIPWIGFSLSKLLESVEPLPEAKYVAFETLYDPMRMPGQRTPILQWPYVEGLRLDEAMHPLTILATGLYGRALPPQDGAPIRLVVPWKYGFKGIKSIVKISLVAAQPATSWNRFAPDEYGFYANVNPQVDHPRWSQATEQRIGEFGRRPTLPFNGYADQVAHLYKGIDLRTNF